LGAFRTKFRHSRLRADLEKINQSDTDKIPIDQFVPGANNIKNYPETVWKSDADGKLELSISGSINEAWVS
jgi:hypothetical protein